MNPTTESIDKCLKDMGSRRLVPIEDLPEFLDTSGLRIITEKTHEQAMTNPGETRMFVESVGVIDLLLDKRNEVIEPEPALEPEPEPALAAAE